MINILLVDDEPWIRTGLKNKIEWTDELNLCGEASNGYEALKLAVNLRPDILITDVRMPGMSGIELLEKMLAFLPDLQSIFVSGYSDFEYVKSALTLDACGYVLKPINKEELNKTIERTLKRIHKNNQIRRTMQTQMELLQKFLESFQRSLPVPQDIFCQLLKDLHFFTCHMYFLYISIIETGEDSSLLQQKLNSAIAAVSDTYTSATVPVNDTVSGLFISSDKEIDIISYSRRLIRALSAQNLDASLALGTPAHSFDEVPRTFMTAKNSRQLMHPYSIHEIVLPSTKKAETSLLSLPDEFQREILNAIYSHDSFDLDHALTNLETFVREQEGCTLSDIARILHLLMGNIIQFLYEHAVTQILVDEAIAYLQKLPNNQMLKEFRSFCQKVVFYCDQHMPAPNTIQKMEQYIKEHFQEDLSLKKMASLFYLNASYFSVFFKNNTGKNFNEYLTELRIEHAKELLSEKNLKIHQIAFSCGYSDSSYFCRIFRKTTGVTPAEYQKNHES